MTQIHINSSDANENRHLNILDEITNFCFSNSRNLRLGSQFSRWEESRLAVVRVDFSFFLFRSACSSFLTQKSRWAKENQGNYRPTPTNSVIQGNALLFQLELQIRRLNPATQKLSRFCTQLWAIRVSRKGQDNKEQNVGMKRQTHGLKKDSVTKIRTLNNYFKSFWLHTMW